ncbi:MAG: TonB-dependent receptor, partial [Proteobacteria bacterium]|nr:TonB-dependent receptor [Pseudomonadota bacterium]
EPLDGLRFSVDYFDIELTNKVNTLTVQETINLVADGVALPPGVEIVRGATLPGGVPGVIDFITKPFANLSSQSIKGFDVRGHYDFETDNAGDFAINLDYSQIDEFSEITIQGQPRVEFAGQSVGAPKYQAALNLRWMYGDWTVNTISRFIDSHGTDTQQWDSYNRHDMTINYLTSWDGSITLGVRNIADEDPILENGTTWEDTPGLWLYDVAGRTIFASYKHEF